jgi:uncharacterized protein
VWRGPGRLRDRILLRVAFYGLVVVAVLPWLFSSLIITPHRQPTHDPEPGFEEIWLSSEGLRLRAWLLRGDPERAAAVVVHGLGDSIESYAGVARRFRARGHTVLLLELRGHGRSQGERTTLGGREREDGRAALEWLRVQNLAPRGFIASGVSMGAVAILRAAADREDVHATIAEAPYDSFRETMAHHARLLYGLPRWLPVVPMAIAVAEWRAGFRADDVDSVAAARRLRSPLLLIVDGADPRMPEAVVRRILDAHRGPKRLWVAEGEPHAGASLNERYWETVDAFLSESGV